MPLESEQPESPPEQAAAPSSAPAEEPRLEPAEEPRIQPAPEPAVVIVAAAPAAEVKEAKAEVKEAKAEVKEAKAEVKEAKKERKAGKPPKTAPAPPKAEEPATPNGESGPPSNKKWYVVKVQSGREETIKEAIERRVKIEGLEEYFGQIKIPVEKVIEVRHTKEGKTQRVTRNKKLFPGYLMVECEYNDRILYLFRETSGVGDFVGGSVHHPPPPMSAHEVARMQRDSGQAVDVPHGKPKFGLGDRVKVKEGPFAGMEGEVKDILEAKDKVRVELTIFGRPVPVELEYWAVEQE